MSDHMIPGPDPGACPDCGQWLKAGILHRCPEPVDDRPLWPPQCASLADQPAFAPGWAGIENEDRLQ